MKRIWDQVLNENVILVSGGFPHKGDNKSIILPDELYNITSGKVAKVIELKHSLRRAQHAIAKTGTQVLAFGGVDKNNKLISRIAGFNATINAWTSLSQDLLSTNTSNLMVTAFPTSALDCVPQCRCGTTEQKGRIFGGTEAEVIISIQFFFSIFLGSCLPLDCCASTGRRSHRGLHQEQMQCYSGEKSSNPASQKSKTTTTWCFHIY